VDKHIVVPWRQVVSGDRLQEEGDGEGGQASQLYLSVL
jgi:hypothetical protein